MGKIKHRNWWILFSLLGILLIGAYFRFISINWDQNYHLHPDERFLTMIETSISFEDSISDYFNTGKSTLNPHNVVDVNGNQTFPFFVYGTFPLFLVQFVGEVLNQTGYSQIHIIGRYFSGLFDLTTIIFIFLIAKKMFNSSLAGIIASAFYAFAALPIQISHFFIVDNFTTFFSTAAFYFAVGVLKKKKNTRISSHSSRKSHYLLADWDGFRNYFFFAIALGLAAASKINAVVVAFLLPVAVLLSVSKEKIDIRSKKTHLLIRNLIVAGILSFLFFRIFQPYAFNGPGFFNLGINPAWIADIKELRALSSGLSNYPPSLQWTRRSFFFPLQNMIFWGMGLAFGLISFISLIVMFARVLQGKSDNHFLLLIWNAVYILWQIARWNPTMRYFLPVYPTMAISASWLLTVGLESEIKPYINKTRIRKALKIVLIIISLFVSIGWGFAFINIYKQPMTRIAASEWIYENIEGPVNLLFDQNGDEFSQPVSYRKDFTLGPSEIFDFSFSINTSFPADQILIEHIQSTVVQEELYLRVEIIEKDTGDRIVSTDVLIPSQSGSDQRGQELLIEFPETHLISTNREYILTMQEISGISSIRCMGTIHLRGTRGQSQISKAIFMFSKRLDIRDEFQETFSPFRTSLLEGIDLYRVRMRHLDDESIPLCIKVLNNDSGEILLSEEVKVKTTDYQDHRGERIKIQFDQPVKLNEKMSYELIIHNMNQNQDAFITGSQSAKETDWDDSLPLFMHGLNPFDLYSGVYQSDLNFQMYWDDNPDKFERFVSILDKTDYIILSSNRQWGSVTQALEKYPLSNHLYRGLIDCGERDVQRCYIEAKPTGQSGPLGFELIKTFHFKPQIFGWQFNTQKAEEAFSVYDHPKVFIFKKQEAYEYNKMLDYLEHINLDQALNEPPDEIEKRPGLLTLDDYIWAKQHKRGTWSDLFNTSSLLNKNQIISVLVWYSFISVLGWTAYPICRIIFNGLIHKGWGLSRLLGLVMLSYLVWLGASSGIPATKPIILAALFILILFNAICFINNKTEIIHEIRTKWKHLLSIELIFLGLFLLFLLIRLGNPDLWHPYKGGEKPMDFAYFNAIVKSIAYPPYDPWYAGGYINYYYWGLLLGAIPTKILGIIPAIAYNLILPTFFAMTGIGAFTIGGNLSRDNKRNWILAGFVSVGLVLFIGNLGTIKMIFEGFIRLGQSNINTSIDGIMKNGRFFLLGVRRILGGGHFNYYPGDWYWIPSRAIPGESITEFPFFTFLYGDPHAHLFAYPITLMVINWALSMILNKWRYASKSQLVISLLLGALMVGALRPTNTWDLPVFLFICGYAIVYTYIKHGKVSSKLLPKSHHFTRKIIIAILLLGLFTSLAFFFFNPFSKWYGQAYTTSSVWKGDKTPLGAYLSHWGIFLFIIASWLGKEIIYWMKATPLSRINEWRKSRGLIVVSAIILLVFSVYLIIEGIFVSFIVVPVVMIALLMALRKDISESLRVVFLLVCLGFSLTLIVEIVVLSGDIGRMNTVFKFYLQAWTCIALSASYALISLCNYCKKVKTINSPWKTAWKTLLILLLFSGALYPIFATTDKLTDRIAENGPITLDGMAYMRLSKYSESNVIMDLSQDYNLIQWMQEHLDGTPRIIEANVPEYRWGSRISIYTGLPGVIGWNWHQRQQRAINPGQWIFDRVDDVTKFYSTADWEGAEQIINLYEVDYIVIGQLEKAVYSQDGIAKFKNMPMDKYEVVYESEDTMLIRVRNSND